MRLEVGGQLLQSEKGRRKIMKKVISVILFVCSTAASASGFIHPMDFDGSERSKKQVVEYVQARVRYDYCDSGLNMCQPTTLRMMEEENLDSFKRATAAEDREIMDQVINDYCYSGLDMCSYSTIWMMYQENLRASRQQLAW